MAPRCAPCVLAHAAAATQAGRLGAAGALQVQGLRTGGGPGFSLRTL